MYRDSPTTVPQVEGQIPQESHVTVLDIDRRSQSSRVLGDVIRKDDGAHRRLSRSALAHQKHLLLLLGLFVVHLARLCLERDGRLFGELKKEAEGMGVIVL